MDFEGNKSMWFALRDTNTFNRISRMMIATSVIGAVMNVIPLFFYNLTETKQKGMSKALKLRAMFEDYSNGILSPELRDECREIIDDVQNGAGNEEENGYVRDELAKYDAPEMQRRLALAREIVGSGYEGILRFDAARLGPAKDKEEKLVLREMKEAQKYMARFFPDANPVEPDIREMDALYEKQTSTRQEAKALRGEIEALEQQRLLFYRSTKPYTRAKRLLERMENAGRLEEILGEALVA